MRWNRKSLREACEALLQRPDTRVRLRTIQDNTTTAKSTYHWQSNKASDILITLDPAKGGLVESALHETLHIVLNTEINDHFNYCLEETIIAALESELWRKAITRRSQMEKWRRLLKNKLS